MLARAQLRLPGPATRRLLADVLVVVAILGMAALDPVWERDERSAWEWLLAAALTGAALLLRRRAPLVALVAVLALFAAVHPEDARDDPPFQFIALLIAMYALGAHASLRVALAGLMLATVVFGVLNVTRGEGADAAIAGAVQFSVMLVFGRLIGGAATRERALAERAAQLEIERDVRAQEAVADERGRIARDLHDALGHTVSAIVLQVGAVRRRLGPEQQQERETLLQVERSGRQSVTELRRMLGMLREERPNALEPLPSLARVEDLAENVRRAGTPVDVRVEGEPERVPAGVDVAGFRIVQEALTNVLRHADAARATVRVAYEPESLLVEVLDDGAAARRNGSAEPGHGLIGMRERVAVYGGRLDAGPRPEGGFAVRARLPYGWDGQ